VRRAAHQVPNLCAARASSGLVVSSLEPLNRDNPVASAASRLS